MTKAGRKEGGTSLSQGLSPAAPIFPLGNGSSVVVKWKRGEYGVARLPFQQSGAEAGGYPLQGWTGLHIETPFQGQRILRLSSVWGADVNWLSLTIKICALPSHLLKHHSGGGGSEVISLLL